MVALGSTEGVSWPVACALASLLGVEDAEAPAGEAGAAVAAAQSEVAAFPFHVTLTSAACPGGRRRGRSACPTGQAMESHTCWEPEETRTPRAWLPTSSRY